MLVAPKPAPIAPYHLDLEELLDQVEPEFDGVFVAALQWRLDSLTAILSGLMSNFPPEDLARVLRPYLDAANLDLVVLAEVE